MARTAPTRTASAWIALLASGVLEAVWATALGRSHGFTEPLPSLVFLVSLALSMAGLGWAAKRIPIGTAYAVWVGIGAALTVGFALATGAEAFSPLKALFLAGIVLAVVGLKLLPSPPSAPIGPAQDAAPDPSASDQRLSDAGAAPRRPRGRASGRAGAR
ncbi:DMT family transporter [Schumannella soli]|uniref:Multidrug efflux SMR transporter n=1 Tax=Schumannella soli TaxID=2590779 RepID=A0A506YAA2_9MICO|nr:multidrug efflux SMR transporter [Schumannella soli]